MNVGWETQSERGVLGGKDPKGGKWKAGAAIDCKSASERVCESGLVHPDGNRHWDFGVRNVSGILLQQIQNGTDVITIQEDGQKHIDLIFGGQKHSDHRWFIKNSVEHLAALLKQTADQLGGGAKLPHAQWQALKAGMLAKLESWFLNPMQAVELELDILALSEALAKYKSHRGGRGGRICQMYNGDKLHVKDRVFYQGDDPVMLFQPGRPYMVTTFAMVGVKNELKTQFSPKLMLINAHAPHVGKGSGHGGFPTGTFNAFFKDKHMQTCVKHDGTTSTHRDAGVIDFIVMQGDLNRRVKDSEVRVEVASGHSWDLRRLGLHRSGTYVGFESGLRAHAIDTIRFSPGAAFRATKKEKNRWAPDNILYADFGSHGWRFGSKIEAGVLSTRGPASDHAPVMARFEIIPGGTHGAAGKGGKGRKPISSYGARPLHGKAASSFSEAQQARDVYANMITKMRAGSGEHWFGDVTGNAWKTWSEELTTRDDVDDAEEHGPNGADAEEHEYSEEADGAGEAPEDEEVEEVAAYPGADSENIERFVAEFGQFVAGMSPEEKQVARQLLDDMLAK